MGKKKLNNGEIASAFVQQDAYIRDLVYCTEYNSFYFYKDGHYIKFSDDEIQALIYKYVRIEHITVPITASVVKDIVKLMSWECYRQVKDTDHSHIAFDDKLLNINTFKPREFSKDIIVTHHIPCNYDDLEMETPTFKKFLETSLVYKEEKFKTDQDLVSLVQQMFGFVMIEDLKAGAAFFLVGNGANGKSVMATILQNMVGMDYCSAMSIQTLTTDKFATHHLIGKKLNMSNEEESKYIRSDKFKALITGEMVSAQKKFGDSFEFIPRTKYIFATNQIPTFEGINYGIVRRLHIIPFHRQFKPDEMDHTLLAGEGRLGKQLQKELPGIIGWAMEGAKELVRRNYSFVEAEQAKIAMVEFENEVSSAVRFIRDVYYPDPNGFVPNVDLYNGYRHWCEDVGKKPMNKFSFERDIRNTMEDVKSVQGRDIEGKNKRGKTLSRIDKIMDDEEEVDIEDINF